LAHVSAAAGKQSKNGTQEEKRSAFSNHLRGPPVICSAKQSAEGEMLGIPTDANVGREGKVVKRFTIVAPHLFC